MTLLVTGGAGFIGSNFVHHWLAGHDELLVNLDKLTYAGNLGNLQSVAQDKRHVFVQGDIGDTALVTQLLNQYQPRAVLLVGSEVQRGVGDDPEHRGPVPLEETAGALGPRDRRQRARDAAFASSSCCARPHPPRLEQDLHSLEGGDAGLGDGTGCPPGDQFLSKIFLGGGGKEEVERKGKREEREREREKLRLREHRREKKGGEAISLFFPISSYLDNHGQALGEVFERRRSLVTLRGRQRQWRRKKRVPESWCRRGRR